MRAGGARAVLGCRTSTTRPWAARRLPHRASITAALAPARRGPRSDIIARRLIVALILAASVAAIGCGRRKDSHSESRAPAEPEAFKIGIMTGTSSQGGGEFRAGQLLDRKYAGRVMHITFSDNFPRESITVVAQLTGLAKDERVRVMVVGQAVPGALAAARQIRDARRDVLIGLVSPHEDPDSIDAACDLTLGTDALARGADIIAAARTMGARTFVHYSFPRHLSQRMVAQRRDVMARTCRVRGMRFCEVEAPDPAGSEGLAAARKFILEDVPRRLDSLGTATAFYATCDGLQEPLIKAILTTGVGYFVEQDVPSPTAGYPEALGLKFHDDQADTVALVQAEIRREIAVKGMSGHFGGWAADPDVVALRAATTLLVDAADGKADPSDSTTVLRYLAAEAGVPVRIRRYAPGRNHWLIAMEHITY